MSTEIPNITTSASTMSPVIKAAPCYLDDSVGTRTSRILAYSIIMLVSLIANSLVIAIIRTDKKMKKPINYFIMNMCCSDLLITAVYMPRLLVAFAIGFEWQLDGLAGLVSCKIVAFVYESAVTVSILTVVVISLERYLLLVFPLKTIVSNRSSKVIVTVIWMVAIAFRWPIAYGIKFYYKNAKPFCHLKLNEAFGDGVEKLYYNVILIALYAVPLGAIFIFYSIIIITLRRRKTPGQALRQDDRREEKRNRRVLKMVMVVIAVFVICWLLYFVQFIFHSYHIKVPRPCGMFFASFILAHANSAITPCLYFVFNENYRRGLQRMLDHILPRCIKERRAQDGTPSGTARRSLPSTELSQSMTVDAVKNNSVQLMSVQPSLD